MDYSFVRWPIPRDNHNFVIQIIQYKIQDELNMRKINKKSWLLLIVSLTFSKTRVVCIKITILE